MKYLIMLVLLVGCAGKEYKTVDTQMTVYGHIDGEKIGIVDHAIVVQKETSTEAELKIQEFQNYEAARKLDAVYEKLVQCRREIADPRLNGNGIVKQIPDIDDMHGSAEIKEQIGLNDRNELMVVKRSSYLERLTLERRYGDTMKAMTKTITGFNKECENELRVVRVHSGLPAERYAGQGHFDGAGNWITTRPREVTLDDAFILKASMVEHE